MSIRATISPGYRWRLAVLAVVLLGFGLYCVYDGLIGYPGYNQHLDRSINAARQFKEDNPGHWAGRWSAYARRHGYAQQAISPNQLGDQYYASMDIWTQYIMAAILLPLGGLFGFSFLRSGSRWIESDDQGLHTRAGQHAPWDSLTSVDLRRWDNKGIAVVHYDRGRGDQRMTLDDWKYHREPTGRILEQVKHQLGMEEEPTPGPEQEPEQEPEQVRTQEQAREQDHQQQMPANPSPDRADS